MSKAIVIIPTYNERDNVGIVIPKLFEVFTKIAHWDMQVLVVDDTSPDKTYEEVEKLIKKNAKLHLLINKRKAGLGAAYLKGMDYAFDELGADVVFEFDADLSHDPKKIPEFIKKIDEGYDLVLGSRYIPGGGIPSNWGIHRKFLSVVGNIIIAIVMTNFSIRDWTGGYRAIKKDVYKKVQPFLRSQRFSGYTFQIGFLYTAVKLGYRVAEVPFKFVDRTLGHSKMGPEYIKNILLYIFNVRLQELITHRVFKFAVTGILGATVQLSSLQLWRMALPFQLAFFASIETAIVSNFIVNNLWTFSDRKLTLKEAPAKFVQFNMASGGSIVIQQAIALIGELTIGLKNLFVIPLVHKSLDTGTVFAIVGIFIGMFWNFFAYNTFIWKKR